MEFSKSVAVTASVIAFNLFDEIRTWTNNGTMSAHDAIGDMAIEFEKKYHHVKEWEEESEKQGCDDWEGCVLKFVKHKIAPVLDPNRLRGMHTPGTTTEVLIMLNTGTPFLWDDNSWHNDACDSVICPLKKLIVWIPNGEAAPQFCIQKEGQEEDNLGMFDTLKEVLLFLNNYKENSEYKEWTINFNYKGFDHTYTFTPEDGDYWEGFESNGLHFDVHYCEDYNHICLYEVIDGETITNGGDLKFDPISIDPTKPQGDDH